MNFPPFIINFWSFSTEILNEREKKKSMTLKNQAKISLTIKDAIKNKIL